LNNVNQNLNQQQQDLYDSQYKVNGMKSFFIRILNIFKTPKKNKELDEWKDIQTNLNKQNNPQNQQNLDNNNDQNNMLQELNNQITRLKNDNILIGNNIGLQNQQLDIVDYKQDKVQKSMEKINKDLKKLFIIFNNSIVPILFYVQLLPENLILPICVSDDIDVKRTYSLFSQNYQICTSLEEFEAEDNIVNISLESSHCSQNEENLNLKSQISEGKCLIIQNNTLMNQNEELYKQIKIEKDKYQVLYDFVDIQNKTIEDQHKRNEQLHVKLTDANILNGNYELLIESLYQKILPELVLFVRKQHNRLKFNIQALNNSVQQEELYCILQNCGINI
ncbi:hypothetical protein IMG5_103630, partial [Ichthyophthirius multifiliis]